MGRQKPDDTDRTRQVVAQEAARIIVDHGIRDYRLAKNKAAERLGVLSRGALPGNSEIEAAVAEHLQIFGGESHADQLRLMRVAAPVCHGIAGGIQPAAGGSGARGNG